MKTRFSLTKLARTMMLALLCIVLGITTNLG